MSDTPQIPVGEPIEVSSLPGATRLRPTLTLPEERGFDGGTRALSHVTVQLRKSGEPRVLEIAHQAEPVIASWDSVANQRFFVWARFRDRPQQTVAGAIFVHPHGVGDLKHPLVLYADPVQTLLEFQGDGIASALYGHLDALGYRLMKSPIPMGNNDGRIPNADRLWDRLHPGYDGELEAGEMEKLTYPFDEESLASLVSKFGNTQSGAHFGLLIALDERVWGFEDWP